MNSTEKWLKNLDNIKEELEQKLLTEQEFLTVLQKSIIEHPNSPIESVHFQIQLSAPFDNILLGNSLQKDETESYSVENLDSFGTTCKIKFWQKGSNTETQTNFISLPSLKSPLTNLIKSYWKPALRDDKSRLISLQYTETKSLINNSIRNWLQNSDTRKVFNFFCDLDKFKQVNSKYGQQSGDRVILEFASILNKSSSINSLVLHRSGDEFVILFPTNNSDDVLLLAKDFMHGVAEHNFNVEGIVVGVSAGIARISSNNDSFDESEARANKVLQPTPENKQRGKARIESFQESNLPEINEFSIKTALCLIKSCIDTSRPFESPWLNLISRQSQSLFLEQKEKLEDGINKLIKWIQPKINNSVIRSSLPNNKEGDNTPVFSSFDVALAVSHGVFRGGLISKELDVANKTLKIIYNNGNDLYFQAVLDDVILVELGSSNEQTNSLDLGGFVYTSGKEESFSLLNSKRAVLIKIGHNEINIPESIFVEKIIVDDRPTRGGGLPDFWEATIAKIIALSNNNTNIEGVFVLGDHKYAALTAEKLKKIEIWKDDVERISYKTEMSQQSINIAIDRLKGKVYFPNSEEELIQSLTVILTNPYELKESINPENIKHVDRFLRREIDLGNMALGEYDGCSVKTIAEAFPVVLDIVRRPQDENPQIIDQAGEQFRELVDFKVLLKEPRKNIIPAFYKEEEDSLKKYFENVFLDSNQLFGEIFEKSGQLELVLNHLKEASIDPKHQFGTRRAVLIVPNPNIKFGEDFAPLGLISIRIIPRFEKNRITLSFSYTWRTVEVLVGFPYSIYGSVKYSEHLTEKFRERLPEPYRGNLEMGTVSYIAHSLHIFLDEHRQNIARKIVDNASF